MGSTHNKTVVVPIVQALAPYPEAGCCVVIGLVPRTLYMDLYGIFRKTQSLLVSQALRAVKAVLFS